MGAGGARGEGTGPGREAAQVRRDEGEATLGKDGQSKIKTDSRTTCNTDEAERERLTLG